MSKTQLIGLLYSELEKQILDIGEKKFRAKQLWNWLYVRGERDFDNMWNFAKEIRSTMKEKFTLELPKITKRLISGDGTKKWLIDYAKNQEAETVYIPEDDRGTLCVSSQVGCSLTCKFCHTGTQKWVRNLIAYDIISQVIIARNELQQWPSTRLPRMLSNIVFMGMGEPLLNYDNVANAIKIITSSDGIAISRRRVNLSTSGYVPNIYKAADELRVNLAISLHAVADELRDELVPINSKFPIAELLKACKYYSMVNNDARITFEYVMLKDVNDSDADARALVRLIRDIPAMINLIPFNMWEGAPYQRSSEQRIASFVRIIKNAGYPSPVRKPRGEDIMAACGQLKSQSIRVKG